ncbi:phospholipid scramblase 2-like [Acipenser oxyrinchus oxyrinchus]|uniref:Phospholipid scramblase n=1 Tax=Acipenser oxyrinchus oxyrinchus TaxID=40147 RepID=A0AAD8FU13_ACIOX|nr:phospholipid scramblase 2-like [Acipenser oxyrinchus oxyrinchus]
MSGPGYPPPNQPPYPVPQPGGYSVPPYPMAQPGYGDPTQPTPPPGFSVYPQPGGYQSPPPHGYQPSPQPQPGAYQGPPPHGYQPAPIAQPGGYQPGPLSPPHGYQPAPTNAGPSPAQDPHNKVTPYSAVPTGVPPGLEYLTQIDQILVHQKVELLEAFIGFETNNKYEIKNSMGQKIYKATEKNDCCTRNCCGSLRHFNMKITDNNDQEVIHLVRPYKCASCWCPCCLQELEVQAPRGTTIGYVVQTWHPFLPKFSIQNASRETVMRVVGPCFACNCCGDINFELKTKDEGASVGRISKQWSGLLKEVFTDTDNFGIQFPLDLDVKVKAVLLGACFLIDFMFFEKTGEMSQRNTVLS